MTRKTWKPPVRLQLTAAVLTALAATLPMVATAQETTEPSVIIKTPTPRFPGDTFITNQADLSNLAAIEVRELAPGGAAPPPSVELIFTEYYPFGHWQGVGAWYRITNDADATNRYYITNTQWTGMGSSGRPSEHGIFHLDTTIYHAARAQNVAGNPYFLNFEPLDVNPYTGTRGFSVGMNGPSASYSWQQTGPAYLRYDQFYNYQSDYTDTEYTNTATYAYYQQQTTGKLEWAASGVVPAGPAGVAWLSIDDHSQACGWTCDHYYDSTGWRSVAVDWA